MHILIALVLALAALYVWLSGHWFGRVVAFLVLGTVLGLAGASSGASVPFPAPAAKAPTVDATCPPSARDPFCVALRGTPADIAAAAALAAQPVPSTALTVAGGLAGLAAAWLVSGLPVYRQRRQSRALGRRQRVVPG